MNLKAAFRLLIVVSWVAPLVGEVVTICRSNPFSASHVGDTGAASLYTSSVAHHGWAWWAGIACFAGAGLSLLISVGVWAFSRWARNVYIPFAILYIWFSPFGPNLPPPVQDIIAFVTYGTQGAIAALAFASPLSSLFSGPRSIESRRETVNG